MPGSERGCRKSAIRQLAGSLLYRMPGSEGGVEKHSTAVRSAPTLQAGWYAVLADPQMPATSTLLDQAHNAIARKLFAMKGFHHPDGSQQAFLTGLAHLYNLAPYQRRARHAGQCGVEVEGGRVLTADWFLNVQILTSGGFRRAVTHPTTKSDGMR
jgi:hypothetical protein